MANSINSDDQNDVSFSAYPNPFNTEITFKISDKVTKFSIYTLEGKILKTLNNIDYSSAHEIIWDGTTDNGDHIDEGIYIVQLITYKGAFTRKIIYTE